MMFATSAPCSRFDGFATVCFHHDAEQRVAVRTWLGPSPPGKITSSSVFIPQPFAAGGHYPDDAETAVTDAHQLAQCGRVAEHLRADLGADDRLGGAAPPIGVRQETPLREAEAAHFQELRRGTGHHHFAQLAVDANFGSTYRQRRNQVYGGSALQGLRIVDGEVARRIGNGVAGIEAAGLRTPRQHDDQIAADRRKLAHHISPRTVAERRQHHYRSDTDGHGQDH